jgi:hypothetical protein
MKMNVRRVALDVLKALLFVVALLYFAAYFGWDLFSEAGGIAT